MENFVAYNPVQLHFGKGIVSDLGKTVRQYGTKALLVYGKGSVKKNGSYDDVVSQLEKFGIEVTEYSGIKSNPVIEDVQNAVKLGLEKQVDMVIALGGGSVIDSAKMIALCIPGNHDAWEVMKMRAFPKESLPVITVLTLAATGSEMNMFAVVQNPETGEKMAHKNPLIFPKHSFLDPVYTYSVSPEYTAYGIADLIAHTFEAFFAAGKADLSDRFVQAIGYCSGSYALCFTGIKRTGKLRLSGKYYVDSYLCIERNYSSWPRRQRRLGGTCHWAHFIRFIRHTTRSQPIHCLSRMAKINEKAYSRTN